MGRGVLDQEVSRSRALEVAVLLTVLGTSASLTVGHTSLKFGGGCVHIVDNHGRVEAVLGPDEGLSGRESILEWAVHEPMSRVFA